MCAGCQEMERLHQDETQIMTRAQTDLELELDRMKKQEFALEAKVGLLATPAEVRVLNTAIAAR